MGKIIKIDVNTFWKGVSTSDFLPDAGYSSEDKGHNLYIKKGLLWPQPLEINKGTLAGDGIAASGFNNELSPVFSGIVPDGNDGCFYNFSDIGVPTLIDTDTVKNYSEYKTDMIFYDGSFFITSTTNITKLNNSMGSYDNDWWTAVVGGSSLHPWLPHQMIEFDDVLYIADENNLKSWDGSSHSNSALDLSAIYKITAIIVYQNLIYITVDANFNASGSRSAEQNVMFVWDGSSSSCSQRFFIPEKIFTLMNFNGQLLLFGKYSVYIWNGINCVKIFDLPSPSNPVYKQKITQIKNRIYFANGDFIITFDGQRFSYLYDTNNASTDISTQTIQSLTYIKGTGNKQTAIMTGNSDSYELDLENNAGLKTYTGTSKWRSNRYEFSQNIRIDKIFVELGEALTEDTAEVELSIINERGVEIIVGSLKYSDGDRWSKQFYDISIFALSFQLRINFKTYAKPIRSVSIYYEPSTQSLKQS